MLHLLLNIRRTFGALRVRLGPGPLSCCHWGGGGGIVGLLILLVGGPPAYAEPLPDLAASLVEFSSVVHFRNNWRGTREKKYECRTLTIAARTRNLPPLVLTSTGLGEVAFSPETVTNCESVANWVQAIRIVMSPLTPELKLTARFTGRELVDPGNALQGKLILWSEGFKPQESAVRVERLPGSPAFRSALWFLGVAVPALVAFLIGWRSS